MVFRVKNHLNLRRNPTVFYNGGENGENLSNNCPGGLGFEAERTEKEVYNPEFSDFASVKSWIGSRERIKQNVMSGCNHTPRKRSVSL